jgi:2'-5' RNA ligase
MKRVFAAIDISDDARTAIGKYVSNLRNEFSDLPIRWEKTEKLHLTVKFAGSLDENELGKFKQRVNIAAASIEPFRIAVTGTGAFVKRRGPGVLWLGIEIVAGNDATFARLSSKLDEEEKRPFNPHITIARINDTKKAKTLIEKHLGIAF